jgi:hypothetical protein
MNLEIKLGMVFLMSVLMMACASGPLKAPCNQYANFCGTKTKINQ